jgi:hypothetical protein
MAQVEIEDDRGIKGILLDGYFPDFSFFQKMDWEQAKTEKLSGYKSRSSCLVDYERYLSPSQDTPGIGTQSNFHRKLVQNTRGSFCPYDMKPCAQFVYPARGVKPIERIIKLEKKKVRDFVLPVFSKEIEKDLTEGKANYEFNMAFLDLSPNNHCPKYEECNTNWMEFSGFSEKEKDDYTDFQSYKEAAKAFLKGYIDFGIHNKWFERARRQNYPR